MAVSTEKSKIMTKSTIDISADISMNSQKLEEVTSFKYLEASLCKEGTCSAEIRVRIVSAMEAMARLKSVWRYNTISFASQFKLYWCLGTTIFLSRCETWTLLTDSEKGSKLSKPSACRNFSASPTWSARPTTGCEASSTSLWVHRNLF